VLNSGGLVDLTCVMGRFVDGSDTTGCQLQGGEDGATVRVDLGPGGGRHIDHVEFTFSVASTVESSLFYVAALSGDASPAPIGEPTIVTVARSGDAIDSLILPTSWGPNVRYVQVQWVSATPPGGDPLTTGLPAASSALFRELKVQGYYKNSLPLVRR